MPQHHASTMLLDEITRFVAAKRTSKTGFIGTTGQVLLEQQVLPYQWITRATRLFTLSFNLVDNSHRLFHTNGKLSRKVHGTGRGQWYGI